MFFRAAAAGSIAYLYILVARFVHSEPVPPAPPVVVHSEPVPPAPPVAVVPRPLGDSTRVVDVRRADLEPWTALAASARIVPSFRDGAAIGVKLYAIRPDSPLAMIGLENGDTLIAVNDVPASSPDLAMEIYGCLVDPDHFDIDVERRGARMRIVVLLH